MAPATAATGGKAVVIKVKRGDGVVALGPVAPRFSEADNRYLFGIQLEAERNGTKHSGPLDGDAPRVRGDVARHEGHGRRA